MIFFPRCFQRHTKPSHRVQGTFYTMQTILGGAGYTLGLKGPQALLDTACSSALVAYGALVGELNIVAGGFLRISWGVGNPNEKGRDV